MKKILAVAFVLLTLNAAFAQNQKDSTTTKKTEKKEKKDWSKVLLGNRAADHFMIQIGYDNWSGKPDTITTVGFSRSFNFYVMFDFPFKTDPRFSVGAGLGIGSSNIFFDKQEVLVAALNPTLAFPNTANSDHFKKYKLVSTYLDIPLELRYAFNPENMNKSWKIALGAKTGFLLSTYTKGKNQLNAAGQTLNTFIEKESAKKYFNGVRLSPMIRVSYGVFGIYFQYQVTPFIKTQYGPAIYPYAIGIVLSGL
ncbi:MAG TPA: outer membrane beta-barrel protein [Puia sp.]|nr:outer membrane beta-barrel protein [Puia sp.]